MDKRYADIVRLLLSVTPDVFTDDVFAMKGGTAINLFVRDMPRLSVDIDVVFTEVDIPRDEAMKAIGSHLANVTKVLAARGLDVAIAEYGGGEETRLLVNDGSAQVKVEVNHVFRGTVMPVERRHLTPQASTIFAAELEVPTLAVDELYGSKIVAAMDRQHPRDLFDVLQMQQTGGLTERMIECFVVYLAGHNRPIHEVLFPRCKDIEIEFTGAFQGMTTNEIAMHTLLKARDRLFQEVPRKLTPAQRRFLIGLARGEPDWSLLRCAHADELPALRWKIRNLEILKHKQPERFARQAEDLEVRLSTLFI